MRPGRAAEELRRAAARADRIAADLEAAKDAAGRAFGGLADRVSQVESNSARIARLEEQMAEVLAALPKIKGL